MKRVCVIGTGYVGLVTGTCLADIGNLVICVDNNPEKIAQLKQGEITIYEPGLKEIVLRNPTNLTFTTDVEKGIKQSDLIMIAVGTPPKDNGEADLTFVKEVADNIARYINDNKVIVIKSTVPIGTGDWLEQLINERKDGQFNIDVVSNPEFLREGSAVLDAFNPDRIIIGTNNRGAAQEVAEMYEPLKATTLITDRKSAEMIKYASNAFLATKITFINEIANLCDLVGADVVQVAEGMGHDPRIGKDFLRAGIGYGGSCFPKDTLALINMANQYKYDFRTLKAIVEQNEFQKLVAVKKVKDKLKTLDNKTIAILGLAFKPNTDDLRDAASITIINQLLAEGAKIKTYDPVAKKEAQKLLPMEVYYGNDVWDVVEGADALILVTEWEEFKNIDLAKLKAKLKNPIVIDGRNFFYAKRMKELGFDYAGIGR
ncbi:MAG: UDP-glucose dehydrogenase family protein [Carboxydocellales bacterium]